MPGKVTTPSSLDPASIQRDLAALLARIEKLERAPRATHTAVRGGSFLIQEETGEPLVNLDKEGMTVYNIDGDTMLEVRDDGLYVYNPTTGELVTRITAAGLDARSFTTGNASNADSWVEIGPVPGGGGGDGRGAIELFRGDEPCGIIYAAPNGGIVMVPHPDSDVAGNYLDSGFSINSSGNALVKGYNSAEVRALNGNLTLAADNGAILAGGPILQTNRQLIAIQDAESDLTSPPGVNDPDDQYLFQAFNKALFFDGSGYCNFSWPAIFPNGFVSCAVMNGDAAVNGALIVSTFSDGDTTGITLVIRQDSAGPPGFTGALPGSGNYRMMGIICGW